MKVIDVFILLLGLVGLNSAYDSICGPNQVYNSCISPCPLTCSNFRNPPNCSPGIVCQGGCVCREGYVLNNGVCVPIESCPEPRCPGNQTYEFRNIHVRTCDNVQLDPLEPGCYCISGYLLNRQNGQCVLQGDCPTVCGPHQIYKPCATRCRVTCQNHHNPPRCLTRGQQICIEGCDCEPGYVWNNAECIPISKCPPIDCIGNKTYVSNNIHVSTCDHVDLQPLTPGCYCLPGYLLNRRNDNCVLEKDCPGGPVDPIPECIQPDGSIGPCRPCSVCQGPGP
ncbi:hypothetical protein Trydic_g14602 [Trypoxylus dichotomus]